MIADTARDQTGVVIPEYGIEASRIASEAGVPVLIILESHESELNTRWANVLSGEWDDRSWSKWMEVRSYIEVLDLDMLRKSLEPKDLIIATDRNDLFTTISVIDDQSVCKFDRTKTCKF